MAKVSKKEKKDPKKRSKEKGLSDGGRRKIFSVILALIFNHWAYLYNFKKDWGKFLIFLCINWLVIIISISSFLIAVYGVKADDEVGIIISSVGGVLILITRGITKILVVIERLLKRTSHYEPGVEEE